jgi:hypothetical protein
MELPPIYFYLPKRYFPQSLPVSADENWLGFGLGIYAWTLQTYLRLQANGFPCQLVSNFPTEGIVLVHRNALRAHRKPLKPGQKILLICLKAEERPYPYAQLHVVQNPVEVATIKDSYYLPHWTQPGLIPRHHERGNCFENIAFFGHATNLTPELQTPSWEKQLAEIGLRWCPILNDNNWQDYSSLDSRWHDYSNVDAIVAVRSFNSSLTYSNKPATKLYNAWLAKVPALLGGESAYQSEGQKNVNYLEVTSRQELIDSLKKLQEDSSLRQTLTRNGWRRGQDFLPEKTTKKWQDFLTEVAIPAFHTWCDLPRYFQLIILQGKYFNFAIERAKLKFKITAKIGDEDLLLSKTRSIN